MGLLGEKKGSDKKEDDQIRRLVREHLDAQCEAVIGDLLPKFLEDFLPRLVREGALLSRHSPEGEDHPDHTEPHRPQDFAELERLEARVRRIEECFQERFFCVERPGTVHKETIVKDFSDSGAPVMVETVLKNGLTFLTAEPPEMDVAGDPLHPSALKLPKFDMPLPKLQEELSGPMWGNLMEEEEEMLELIKDDTSPRHSRKRSPWRTRAAPWHRPPDIGCLDDSTARWNWCAMIDWDASDDDKLGLYLFHRGDTDDLVVTRVREDGPVARWNSANLAWQVEPGDVLKAVDEVPGSGQQLMACIGNARSLTFSRDMASWHHIKATKMGYVEQPGSHPRGILC
jgi:hypothetical protein